MVSPYSLHMINKDRFTTFLGGITSIIILMITAYLMISMIIQVLSMTEMKTRTNRLYRNFINGNNTFTISPKQVNIAIRWENSVLDSSTNGSITPDVGTITASNNIHSTPPTSGTVSLTDSANSLDMEPCDEHNFSDDPDILALVQGYQCISSSTNFTLSGNSFSRNYSNLEILFQEWVGIGCKTPNERYLKLHFSNIHFVILSTYLDFDNIEKPIQKFYDFRIDSLSYETSADETFYIKPNEYSLQDSKFGIGSPKTGNFYTKSRSEKTVTQRNLSLLTHRYIFTLDAEYEQYERTMMTVFEVIGTVGGVYEMIYLFMKFLVPLVTTRIFEHSLVSRLNQTSTKVRVFKPKNVNRVHNYAVENKAQTASEDVRIKMLKVQNKSSSNNYDFK